MATSGAPAPPAPAPVVPTAGRKRNRPPPLLRISRGLHRASSIGFVLLIIFVATVGYSAITTVMHLSNVGSSSHSNETLGINNITSYTTVNLTNSGFYPIQGLSLTTLTYLSGGQVVGSFSSPSASIAAGATYAIPVELILNTSPGSPGQQVLVENGVLNEKIWLNATFGYFFPFSVSVSPSNGSMSFGAPFEGFAVQATVASGSANVTIAFTNNASVDLYGAMSVKLLSSSGTTCGTALYENLVALTGQGPLQPTSNVSVGSCVPAEALATMTGSIPNPFSFTLPEVQVT